MTKAKKRIFEQYSWKKIISDYEELFANKIVEEN